MTKTNERIVNVSFLVNFRFLFRTDRMFATWNNHFERRKLIKFTEVFIIFFYIS